MLIAQPQGADACRADADVPTCRESVRVTEIYEHISALVRPARLMGVFPFSSLSTSLHDGGGRLGATHAREAAMEKIADTVRRHHFPKVPRFRDGGGPVHRRLAHQRRREPIWMVKRVSMVNNTHGGVRDLGRFARL